MTSPNTEFVRKKQQKINEILIILFIVLMMTK